MVDITNFGNLTARPFRLRRLTGLMEWLPHAVFALCFAFTIALVVGLV